MKSIGQRVAITGGMSEFVGVRGTIIDNSERDGKVTMYRVALDEPVAIPGIGEVSDDLWSGSFLRNVKH